MSLVATPEDVEIPVEEFQDVFRKNLLLYTEYCSGLDSKGRLRYQASKVHQFIAKKLMEVVDGGCKRIILTMPPRHGKSRLVSVELPSYLLGRYPEKKIALGSYAQSLCDVASRETRERMKSEEYRCLFADHLDPNNGKVQDWGTTSGGGYLAVGVGGSLTGRGADLLIIDDPHKDFQEAHSPTQRDVVWNWFLSVATTRLAPGAAIIIIMTRWHVDDLVGRLTSDERADMFEAAGVTDETFEVINLPAIAEDNDPIGRKPGEALFPERYPIERLRSIQASMGTYLWSALFTGKPVRKGGQYIDPTNFNLVGRDAVPTGMRWVRYWDIATTEKTTSDYTAGIRGAFDIAGNLWLSDMVRGQWLWPTARTNIERVGRFERIEVGIEAVGGLKSAYQNLREVFPQDVPLKDYDVDADKLTRALPWIALTEQRKVILVDGPWVKEFLKEAESFPTGVHDDQIDAVSGVYSILSKRPPTVKQRKLAGYGLARGLPFA